MPQYIVIETDQGLTVAELPPGATSEETAVDRGGVLVDQGVFHSFDDAYDAMLNIRREEDDDQPAD